MMGGSDQTRGLLVSGRFPELEDALCERVEELRQGRPLAPLAIVVGSAAVRTRIGDLLVRRLGALANVSVVTLAQLARDLVTRARGAPPPVLAGLARERLLRRLVAARASQGLAYFGPVSERPHFAEALAATFADLREARVAPGPGWAAAAAGAVADPAAGADGGVQAAARGAKAADLQALYAAYCEELGHRGFLDGAQVLLEAAAAVSGAAGAPRSVSAAVPGPPAARTILYGIYDLNQAQEAFVGALLAAGADAFVPLPRGGAGEGANALQAARAAGLGEQRREPPVATTDLERMGALWRASRASAGASLELRGDGSLSVVSAADGRGEVREAVRAVLAAASAGAALRDCAVVVPHGDDVERLAAGLRAAGVPVACRLPDRTAGPRLLLRLADCLSPPAGKPFARRAVLDLLLAAPLAGPQDSPRETALWLDEARQAGVVSGLEQWTERVGRRRRGLERRLEELQARGQQADDDEGVERLERVRLRLAAARGLEAVVGALAGACGALPARAPWGVWAETLGEIATALFETPAAAAARDVAGRLRALDVLVEEVEVAVVVAALRAQLAAARVPVGRAGREGVAVLTPLELRGLRFRAVVFTGLAEGGFPVRGRPDPILGDAERRRVAAALGVRLPLAEQRDAESLLLFAFACEAARERLTLLAPRSDAASGRPRLPSRLLLRLASLAAGHPVGLDEFLSGAPLAPVWRHVGGEPVYNDEPETVWLDARERDTAALLALSERARGHSAEAYLAEVLDEPASAGRRLGQWRAARDPAPGAWDGLLGGEALAALAARHPFDVEMHPTRLERYVACPFAFLLRDVFGCDAPEEPDESLEMDAREFGTLAHGILQRAYEAVIGRDLGLDAALAAVASAWELGCAEAERRGVTGAALSWEVQRAMLREDLLESVRRDPVFARGDGRPLGVEWSFGEAAGRPVALALPGGRQVRFAGRLDRVDATTAGARIVDYKTGKGVTEEKRLKDGLSVQLPVYQLAVRQAGEGEYGEIACLYRIVTRRGGFAELELPEDEAAAGERLRRLVAGAAALVDAGLFPRATAGRCDYCDVGYACGSTTWSRARKREHELLSGVVALQGGAPEAVDDAGA